MSADATEMFCSGNSSVNYQDQIHHDERSCCIVLACIFDASAEVLDYRQPKNISFLWLCNLGRNSRQISLVPQGLYDRSCFILDVNQ